MRQITLFSIPISITSKSEALAVITGWVMERKKEKGKRKKVSEIFPSSFFLHPSSLRPKVVVTPNPEMIVAAQKDPEFLKALQLADLAIPDGVGVVAAMRLLQGRRRAKKFPRPSALGPSRVSGISLMENLIALSARRGWRVMLLGGKPGVAHRAAEILIRKTQKTRSIRTSEGSEIRRIRQDTSGDPKLRQSDVSGSPSFPSVLNAVGFSGPGDILHASKHDLDHLITSINKIKPDLLFVAFGHGKQEKWMARYRNRLDVGVMMGVGGALDQIVDPSLRPPAIIDSIGLGWLYRLVREPWRARRQLALARFVWMVVSSKLHHG